MSKKISRTEANAVEPNKPVAQDEPSPVKTIIHELRPQSLTENGNAQIPVPFVSESDVRTAINHGNKIYINAKTILTPSARDLGEEKEVVAYKQGGVQIEKIFLVWLRGTHCLARRAYPCVPQTPLASVSTEIVVDNLVVRSVLKK